MSDQDMQFADPDWKPTSSLVGNNGNQGKQDPSATPYLPRPVNDAWREQAQTPVVETPGDPREVNGMPPYAGYAGYAGSMPSQQQPYQSYQAQSARYRRRRRGPWLWIILLILLISLMGGGFGSLANIGQKDVVEAQTFQTIETPTIILHETNGDIQVQQGSSLSIQADKRAGFFDDPSNIQVNYKQLGDTINVDVNTGGGFFLSDKSVNFTITVPQNVNLELVTDSGNISVDNIQGQAKLSTASGDISANNDIFFASSSLQTVSGDVNTAQDTFSGGTGIGTTSGDIHLDHDTLLQGSEKFNTTSGSIDFAGTVDPNGSYQFNAVSGDISIDLLNNTSFRVSAQTTSGSINADDFPSITVQDNSHGPGSSATGSVGSPPSARFTLQTVSGDITLHQN